MIDRSVSFFKKTYKKNNIFTKEDQQAFTLAQKIIKEDNISFDYKSIPKKWYKIFSIKRFAFMFFEKHKNKLIITDADFYAFFNKRGYNIDEESTFLEILTAAKSIARVF